MIPILYESNETQFKSNGIGRLSDCIRCIVTEERNGLFECEFDYPITGIHYSDIKDGRIIACTHDDTQTIQPFDIYRHTEPIDGIVTFYAHHISYRLSTITVKPFTAGSVADTFMHIKSQSIGTNPFEFWTNKTASGDYTLPAPKAIRPMLGGEENSVLDVYGTGEYEFDKFTVKLYLHRGTDTSVQIRYGKNLVDFSHDVDYSNSYNGIVPYWLGTSMGGGDEEEPGEQAEELVMLPELVVYSEYASHDGRDRIIPYDMSSHFQEKPTVEELRDAAVDFMEKDNTTAPKENFTVNFVQLWQTEEFEEYVPLQRVRLCDTVTVHYGALGIDGYRAKVIKVVYNVLADRYDEMELGEPSTTLAQAVVGAVEAQLAEVPTMSMMETALAQATELIRGGLGGYVYMKPNANGEPEEILIMDQPDIATSVQMIRMNKNGIAFSSNGYDGPFRSAWTIDGAFVADFITAGTLNANVIRAGVIADLLGNTNWNLETGVLTMTKGSITLGGGNFSVNDNGYMTAISGLIGGWTIENNRLYSEITESGTNNVYTTVIAPNDIKAQSYETVGNAKHNLIIELKSGQLYSYYDTTLLSKYGPSGDRNGTLATSIGCYKEFALVPNAGGSVGYRYGGGAGNGSVGAMHYFVGSVKCANSFTVSGSKNREVATSNYGDRLLYCYETPTPLFGDIGEAQLDEDGVCYVDLDDIFTETIAEKVEYQVFLQKEGQGDCWVSEKNPRYFVIQGTPNLKVAWELKAKQKDYELYRLEHYQSMEDRQAEYANYSEDNLLEDYINEQEGLLYG